MCLNRESVVLHGTLIGMGRQAQCMVLVERATIAGTDQYEYSRLMITQAPEELPDGRYKLAFDGRMCEVQRLCRSWINHFWSV
jgi:hypothetical protein